MDGVELPRGALASVEAVRARLGDEMALSGKYGVNSVISVSSDGSALQDEDDVLGADSPFGKGEEGAGGIFASCEDVLGVARQSSADLTGLEGGRTDMVDSERTINEAMLASNWRRKLDVQSEMRRSGGLVKRSQAYGLKRRAGMPKSSSSHQLSRLALPTDSSDGFEFGSQDDAPRETMERTPSVDDLQWRRSQSDLVQSTSDLGAEVSKEASRLRQPSLHRRSMSWLRGTSPNLFSPRRSSGGASPRRSSRSSRHDSFDSPWFNGGPVYSQDPLDVGAPLFSASSMGHTGVERARGGADVEAATRMPEKAGRRNSGRQDYAGQLQPFERFGHSGRRGADPEPDQRAAAGDQPASLPANFDKQDRSMSTSPVSPDQAMNDTNASKTVDVARFDDVILDISPDTDEDLVDSPPHEKEDEVPKSSTHPTSRTAVGSVPEEAMSLPDPVPLPPVKPAPANGPLITPSLRRLSRASPVGGRKDLRQSVLWSRTMAPSRINDLCNQLDGGTARMHEVTRDASSSLGSGEPVPEPRSGREPESFPKSEVLFRARSADTLPDLPAEPTTGIEKPREPKSLLVRSKTSAAVDRPSEPSSEWSRTTAASRLDALCNQLPAEGGRSTKPKNPEERLPDRLEGWGGAPNTSQRWSSTPRKFGSQEDERRVGSSWAVEASRLLSRQPRTLEEDAFAVRDASFVSPVGGSVSSTARPHDTATGSPGSPGPRGSSAGGKEPGLIRRGSSKLNLLRRLVDGLSGSRDSGRDLDRDSGRDLDRDSGRQPRSRGKQEASRNDTQDSVWEEPQSRNGSPRINIRSALRRNGSFRRMRSDVSAQDKDVADKVPSERVASPRSRRRFAAPVLMNRNKRVDSSMKSTVLEMAHQRRQESGLTKLHMDDSIGPREDSIVMTEKPRAVYDDGDPVPECTFSDHETEVEVLDLDKDLTEENVCRTLWPSLPSADAGKLH